MLGSCCRPIGDNLHDGMFTVDNKDIALDLSTSFSEVRPFCTGSQRFCLECNSADKSMHAMTLVMRPTFAFVLIL